MIEERWGGDKWKGGGDKEEVLWGKDRGGR